MVWTSNEFNFGSVLTANKLTNMQANLGAVAEGQTNAPFLTYQATVNNSGHMYDVYSVAVSNSYMHINTSGLFQIVPLSGHLLPYYEFNMGVGSGWQKFQVTSDALTSSSTIYTAWVPSSGFARVYTNGAHQIWRWK